MAIINHTVVFSPAIAARSMALSVSVNSGDTPVSSRSMALVNIMPYSGSPTPPPVVPDIFYRMSGFDSLTDGCVYWESANIANVSPAQTSPVLLGVLQFPHIVGISQ